MKKKMAIAATAIALVLCFAIGGTLAWLVDKTGPVVNTFTYGDINIELAETTTEYKMIPGNHIAKDPTVTVKADSEACWLFVKIEESTDKKFSDFMTYEVADGWTALDGSAGVYYREVAAATNNLAFEVLKNNQVTVKDTVTKQDLNALTTETYPKLTFTAYAVQKDGFDNAAEAWAEASR